MLPLQCAPEPHSFDAKVRKKGLSAIDEFVGRKPRVNHSGPRRKKLAKRESEIPADAFPPYWRDALDDLLTAYHRRCAFLGLYLEHATGNSSVDHMLPKSRAWKHVYEWCNYRLCAASVNAAKRDGVGIVDPFECKEGWFLLELVAFQVTRGPKAPAGRSTEFDSTLVLLNSDEACRAREEYVKDYQDGSIDLRYLERRAPFVARELRRQRRLRRGDI